MHLVKALIIVAKASRFVLAAPSKPSFEGRAKSSQTIDLSSDDAQIHEYSAADYEAMLDDMVTLMAGEVKTKEKCCRECHKICVAVSPVPPAVAA